MIMTVVQILTLMGSLSFGDKNITETETSLFLNYLNLAHLELYGETASFNQALYRSEEPEKLQDISYVILENPPYIMGQVYVPSLKKHLQQISMQEAIQEDPDFTKTGTLDKYVVHKQLIKLLPYDPSPIDLLVWYIPEASLFVKNTPEAEIPYPRSYHNILADGALYYVFQDQSGFKNPQKMEEAKRRWILGKQRLLSYLRGFNKTSLSTFSNL